MEGRGDVIVAIAQVPVARPVQRGERARTDAGRRRARVGTRAGSADRPSGAPAAKPDGEGRDMDNP